MALAPVFFSGQVEKNGLLKNSILAFIVFCAASSAAYLFNDIRDLDSDRTDSRKRARPLASGAVNSRTYCILIAACLFVCVSLCAALPWGVAGMAAAYLAGMALYTVLLKRIWFIGLVVISLGMIARLFAGAAAIDICVSPWVLPCTFFLTAYIVSGKRIYDSGRNGSKLQASVRPVFLMCGLATLGFYIVYTLYDVTMIKYHTHWMFLTSVPVCAGLVRYYLIAKSGKSNREHLESIIMDPVIAASLLLWWAGFLSVIYL